METKNLIPNKYSVQSTRSLERHCGDEKVFYAQAVYDDEEIDAVVKCLNEGWLDMGKYVEEFENNISKIFGHKYGKVGLLISLVAIIGNIVLIPDSIYGFPLFGLGSLGAAISLVIAALTGIFINIYYLKTKLDYYFEKRLGLIFLSG